MYCVQARYKASGVTRPPPWRQRICVIIWNSSTQVFVSSPILLTYSMIYLDEYGLMNVDLLLWVLIYHYLILLLNLFQLWPLEVLPLGSCGPLKYPHQCELFQGFEHIHTFCFRLVLCISCPSLGVGHFSCFLLLKNGLRNQDLGTRYTHCYCGVVSFWSSRLRKKENMCIT